MQKQKDKKKLRRKTDENNQKILKKVHKSVLKFYRQAELLIPKKIGKKVIMSFCYIKITEKEHKL